MAGGRIDPEAVAANTEHVGTPWELCDRKERSRKRARNREYSTQLLFDSGVRFESKNGGTHLVVMTAEGVIDFWPGTGLWIRRTGAGKRRSRGVRKLLRELGLPVAGGKQHG